MKFIHAADLHLDSPLTSLLRRSPRQVERMQRASREAFTRLIDLCIEQEAALLVIAGDLYDHDSPNMQIAMFLRRELRRLEEKGIRCVIIKGNHDAGNRITSALALPANTRMLSDRKPETATFDDLPVRVAVHGQSFKQGPVPENLAASYPPPLPGRYNIGLLHTSLAGAPGGEHDPYAPCTLEQLTSRGYDYWALGHIHRGEILNRDPFVVYAGNLQGRHIRESGPKGCYAVEVDGAGRTASASFVPLDVVRWLRASVDLKGCDSEAALTERLREALLQAWRESDSRAAAVRVELTGRTPLYPLIARRPHHWRDIALMLAEDIAGDDIWVEKIVNDAAAPGGRTVAGVSEAHDLISIMQEIASDPAQIGPLLARELEPLRTKLPGDLKELDALKPIDAPELCRQMLDRLQPRLAARLAGEEDA